MNYSQQRNCILDIVCSNPIHPTAEQVYEQARNIFPRISLGTVYRDLNQLSQMGALKKICSSYGSVRFDGRTDPHFHMECICCGRVFDVEKSELFSPEKSIMDSCGFLVRRYEISIQGICRDCREKNRELPIDKTEQR